MSSLVVGMILIIISSVFALHIYKNRLRGLHLLREKGKLLYALSRRELLPYGFYENTIYLRMGCYSPSEVYAYYWEKDAAEEMHLILKVPGHPILEKGKVFAISMDIPKIDIGTVDLILEGYRITRNTDGEIKNV